MGQRGVSKFVVIFWLTVLFSGIHVGLKLLPMYMNFWSMEDEVKAKASIGRNYKDYEILDDLVKKTKSLDLPLEAKDILLVRDEGKRILKISTQWDVDLEFFWGICGEPCLRTYHFEVVGEGPY